MPPSCIAHLLGEEGEMLAHQAIRRRVADARVERGRAAQVAEHQGDAADLDLVAGPQRARSRTARGTPASR
jgi:hypothetical protein